MYSGDKPFGLFVQRLKQNLENMNFVYKQIGELFDSAGVQNYEKLPDDVESRKKFAVLFRQFNDFLEAAKVQGFSWKKLTYTFTDEETGTKESIDVALDETTYLILVKRYKELFEPGGEPGGEDDVPYDIDGYITTIDTDKIDTEYMNARFEKYMKLLYDDEASAEELQKVEDELHRTFATLSQEEQKFANIILHDIQSGNITVTPGKAFRDYILEYITRSKDDQIHRLSAAIGLMSNR